MYFATDNRQAVSSLWIMSSIKHKEQVDQMVKGEGEELNESQYLIF